MFLLVNLLVEKNRTIESKNFSFSDIQDKLKHGNDTPNLPGGILNRNNELSYEAYGSRKTVYNFSEGQKYSQYIKKNDPQSINTFPGYRSVKIGGSILV